MCPSIYPYCHLIKYPYILKLLNAKIYYMLKSMINDQNYDKSSVARVKKKVVTQEYIDGG